MGVAHISRGVSHLDRPVAFRGREFTEGFALEVTDIARFGSGVELAPLAGKLHALPDPATWSVRLRRSLVPLDAHDERLIRGQLEPMVSPLDAVIDDYLTACRVPR